MKTYRSKIDLQIIIPVVLILTGVSIIMADSKIWAGLAVVLLITAFVIHMFLTTYYQIDGMKLRIKCGFLINKSIDIITITKIIETNNPISSPALSLDRIEIKYNKFDSVIISPKEKKTFIGDLINVKPGIELQLKNISMK